MHELIVDQLVGFLVAEPAFSGSPPRFNFLTWHMCSYFSRFISGFNGAILSVVDDIPVGSEAPVVTS
jgi:hypothetical protein